MPAFKLIVIGASAGGVEQLIKLCRSLPEDLRAAVLIVLHTPSTGGSLLPQILSRAGSLPAQHALHEEEIEPGKLYIAPPNHHLLVNKNRLFLSLGPRENGHRPSVDSLFRSAAQALGPLVIGVILSGTLDDGAMGLMEIHQTGGVTIVQDPQEALFSGMPLNAIQKTRVDYVLPVQEIATKLIELANDDFHKMKVGKMAPDEQGREKQLETDREQFKHNGKSSPRTLLTCPECGGVLWETNKNNVLSYHCQIGHKFSEESMGVSLSNSVETALWTAVRMLEEREALAARMATRAEEQGLIRSVQRFREMETDASQTAAIIRNLITSGRVVSPLLPADDAHHPAGHAQDRVD